MDNTSGNRCASCRAELPALARYCGACGAQVKTEERTAELRQLTVLFCDLVDSTVLADTLDPEDLRDLTAAYHAVCAKVIEQFGGHVAQYLGDGLLVYFGYPVAHEDDARRAVQAAVGIVESVAALSTRLRAERRAELHVRLGVHTGPVVVGEVGEGGRRENLALGRTPNLAARVQAFARTDTVVVSDATLRIVRGYFECEALGTHQLKGLVEPVEMHRVLRVTGAETRLEAGRRSGLTTLTGRAAELLELDELWRGVAQRSTGGHAVLVRGEAGIGKSRMVTSLREHIAAGPFASIECACSPYYQDSALHPIVGALERSFGFSRDATGADKWSALERRLERLGMYSTETAGLIGQVLNIAPPAGVAPLALPPLLQRERTLEALHQMLVAVAREGPTLFVVEDLHWADPTTIDLINTVFDTLAGCPLLAIVTFRSDFAPPLHQQERVSTLTLSRLGPDATTAMISRVAGDKPLPEEIVRQLIARTEGVPLFVEEVTKAVLELGVLVEREGRYELTGLLPPDLIPATVQGSLLARLDRLGEAKPVAQLAAVIGREFRLDVLQAVAGVDESVLRAGLDRLLNAEFIFEMDGVPNATYLFKHALIQDAAYQSLLKKTRRDQHRRIAEVLASGFPEVAGQSPEVVAQHYALGGDADQAVAYWLRAGQMGLTRAAHHEVVAHITRALEQFTDIPASRPRDELELECNVVLTPAMQMTQGWASPGVDRAFNRSLELIERLNDTPHRLRVLSSSAAFYVMRGQISEALVYAEQVLSTATRAQLPALQVVGHGLCCVAQLYHGDLRRAVASGEAALGLLTPEVNQWVAGMVGLAPEVNVSCYLAEAAWMSGFPEEARQYGDRALAAARHMKHGPSEEFAIGYQTLLFHLHRDPERIFAAAEEIDKFGTSHGSAFWSPVTATYKGWAICTLGRSAEGVELMRDGLARYVNSGHGLSQVHLHTALAEGLGWAGRWQEALEVVEAAMQVSASTGEALFEPEAHRLKGEFLWRSAADRSEPERSSRLELADASIREALQRARAQGATGLEVRAATSLVLLRRELHAPDDGRAWLAAVLARYPDDCVAVDVIKARAVLTADVS